MSRLLPLVSTITAAVTAMLCLPFTVLAANGEDTPLSLEAVPAKAAESPVSAGSGVLRTIVGLVVVIGVIYGVTWILKSVKRAREAQSSGTALDSIATLPLGPNRSLHLVRAGDVVILLGVGEGGVTPIRTYHEEEASALGLLRAEPASSALPALVAASDSGRVGRMVGELRRRTVIR